MAKKKEPEEKPNIFVRIGRGFKKMGKGIAKFFRDIKGEIKKIVWPTVKSTFRNVGLVLLSMLIVGVLISGLDYGLHFLLGFLMHVA